MKFPTPLLFLSSFFLSLFSLLILLFSFSYSRSSFPFRCSLVPSYFASFLSVSSFFLSSHNYLSFFFFVFRYESSRLIICPFSSLAFQFQSPFLSLSFLSLSFPSFSFLFFLSLSFSLSPFPCPFAIFPSLTFLCLYFFPFLPLIFFLCSFFDISPNFFFFF